MLTQAQFLFRQESRWKERAEQVSSDHCLEPASNLLSGSRFQLSWSQQHLQHAWDGAGRSQLMGLRALLELSRHSGTHHEMQSASS